MGAVDNRWSAGTLVDGDVIRVAGEDVRVITVSIDRDTDATEHRVILHTERGDMTLDYFAEVTVAESRRNEQGG